MLGAFLLHLSFLLNPFIITIIAAADAPPYVPTDYILLDCGSSTKSSTRDGRNWDGDVGTKFSPNIGASNVSFPADAAEQDPSITQTVPYMTARIIFSPFSYTFPVSPGKKILRLFFYPATYSGNLNKTQFFFSVTANRFTLLRNFSAFLTVTKMGPASLVKEFIINVEDTQILNVTFLPSPSSYAFVNGIEVVSTPDGLYMGTHDFNYNPLKYVNTLNVFYEFDDQNGTAFETLYRLNVGGSTVAASGNRGMFREWTQDDNFILGADAGNPLLNGTLPLQYTSRTPNYFAPAAVYDTARAMGINALWFNLTWIFPVDSGFCYLLRLHFCEINPDLITAEGQRVFTIFINNRTAEPEADVIHWTGGPGILVFRDFAVFVPNASNGRQSGQNLFLALHPNIDAHPTYADAILNGLEIFKLNGTGGNLAGPNPELVGDDANNSAANTNTQAKRNKGNGRKTAIIEAVAGGATGILGVPLLSLLILRARRRAKDFDRKSNKSKLSWARKCYRKGTVDLIVDPNVKGEIAAECLGRFSEIAISCLKDEGIDRPGMSDVVGSLEFALQLQEAADNEGDRRSFPVMFPYPFMHGGGGIGGPMSTTEDDSETETFFRSRDQEKNASTSSSATDKLKSDDVVFSEIMNPTGR